MNADAEMSLWMARLFKPADSPSESFRVTLDLVKGGAPLLEGDTQTPLCSMADVLSAFDRKAFLHMRNELRAQIAHSEM